LLPPQQQKGTSDARPDISPPKAQGQRIKFDRLDSQASLARHSSRRAGTRWTHRRADAAVLFSIARQYGAPLEVLQKALMRDASGKASGPLAAAIDLIAEMQP
jgi:hypothetical protein